MGCVDRFSPLSIIAADTTNAMAKKKRTMTRTRVMRDLRGRRWEDWCVRYPSMAVRREMQRRETMV